MSWPSKEKARERERWVEIVMIHHVVVLCDPQLFIKRRSIKQAPRQMLYTLDHAKRRATHSVICDLNPARFRPFTPEPTEPRAFGGAAAAPLWSPRLSCDLPRHIYSFLTRSNSSFLDSPSPDNEGVIQLSLARCSDHRASALPPSHESVRLSAGLSDFKWSLECRCVLLCNRFKKKL